MKKGVITIHLIFIIIFGSTLWSSLQFKSSKDFNYAIPNNYQSFGIDVSHHQGRINWDTLFAYPLTPPIHFVYLKATEGKDHVDREWEYNRAALLQKKVKHGAYHFFRPGTDPIDQVNHFLKNYAPKPNDLAPVLDIETEGVSDEILLQNVSLFLTELENRTGKRPIIYTSYHFYKTKFQNHFEKHKFWIAAYSEPFLLPKDERILYWQFTDKGELPFHKGVKVDLNVGRVEFTSTP